MNEKNIEYVLDALSRQAPKTPPALLERMLRQAEQYEKELAENGGSLPDDDGGEDD